jgi:hypothetical protein
MDLLMHVFVVPPLVVFIAAFLVLAVLLTLR